MVREYSEEIERVSSEGNEVEEMIWGKSNGVKSRIENIKKYDADLQDVFDFSNGKITVKGWESKIVWDHLRGFQIVPGVILKKLFLKEKNLSENTPVKVEFLHGAFPESTIEITETGLFIDGKEWIRVTKEEEMSKETSLFDIDYKPESLDKDAIDTHVLQSGIFRFVNGAKFYSEKSEFMEWDEFAGFFHIPNNKNSIFSKNSVLDSNILEEIAAQVGTLSVWNILKPQEPKGKILTFKSSMAQVLTQPKLWERVIVKGRVLEVEKRKVGFEYLIHSEEGNIFSKWIIEGNILPRIIFEAMLKRGGAEKG